MSAMIALKARKLYGFRSTPCKCYRCVSLANLLHDLGNGDALVREFQQILLHMIDKGNPNRFF
jgi:hypothetical protein